MPKPSPATYYEYFKRYVDQVPEEDLELAFRNQLPVITILLNSITEAKSMHAYAPGKWTRKETASLPGFEEDDYAANSNANARKWQSLVDEFLAVRKSTEMLYESFNQDMLDSSGISNNKPVTVISLGFTTIGHFYHHRNVIEERYLL
jgi:hypothetical protein